VSTKQQTTDLPNVKLLDLKGNPVIVSGVVFWQIEGIKASVLNVENVYRYVNTTAMATLKQVVSKYPYEEDHDNVFDSPSGAGGSKPGLSLKTEAAQVARELKDVLQDRLAHAGVSVIAFNMTDLSYAPEIAQAMLVRQQAEAMVKVRFDHTRKDNTQLLSPSFPFIFFSDYPNQGLTLISFHLHRPVSLL
jgi:regulator of protease activity HflC (stomatin/prohibitin superfamily)